LFDAVVGGNMLWGASIEWGWEVFEGGVINFDSGALKVVLS
jgi:hypothetical protein